MQNQNTNKTLASDAVREDIIHAQKELLGEHVLDQVFTYREGKRKDMIGFLQAYEGEDYREVHRLSRLWLSLLDHTLFCLSDRDKFYFSVNPHCYEHGIVGICVEWHDFDTFVVIAGLLSGYKNWIDEVVHENKGLAESDVYLRTRPDSFDLLLRPTSAVFYDAAAEHTYTTNR